MNTHLKAFRKKSERPLQLWAWKLGYQGPAVQFPALALVNLILTSPDIRSIVICRWNLPWLVQFNDCSVELHTDRLEEWRWGCSVRFLNNNWMWIRIIWRIHIGFEQAAFRCCGFDYLREACCVARLSWVLFMSWIETYRKASFSALFAFKLWVFNSQPKCVIFSVTLAFRAFMIMSYHHLVISCLYLILEWNHSTVTDVLALCTTCTIVDTVISFLPKKNQGWMWGVCIDIWLLPLLSNDFRAYCNNHGIKKE